MAQMLKLNGVLSILNWYILSLIPLWPSTWMCSSKWIKSTGSHSKNAKMSNWTRKQSDVVQISLYFDPRLSSHSLIHIDRSRPREQTRALVGLSQSSIGQLRSNTIHMFYRRDVRGVVNAIKRQNPQHHLCSPIQWPSARRPGQTQLWHRMSDCSRKCFRSAVKSVHWGFEGPQYENDLCCCGADPTAQQSLGAQWERIQVQVIAGWIWDRRLGQMRISLALWSEDQEAFIA